MFDDIIEKKTEPIEIDKDELIESLKYNIRKKEELIGDLIKQVTELERELESRDSNPYTGIYSV